VVIAFSLCTADNYPSSLADQSCPVSACEPSVATDAAERLPRLKSHQHPLGVMSRQPAVATLS
jgi:hypothetical protein